MKEVKKYGVTVWADEEMDALRKERCLCFNCQVMSDGMCPTAKQLYEMCKEWNIAMMITRCMVWEKKKDN